MPVETLGPGKRIALWTCGCSKKCPGCSNPELWDADEVTDIPEDKLAAALIEMAERSGIDRLTITGGDPLEQPHALIDLLRKIRAHFKDILIYTGYTLEDVVQVLGSDRFETLKDLCDALIDGPYIERLNDGQCALRGSTNQELHLFNANLQKDYEFAMSEPRRVQNIVFDGRSMSIGIHGAKTGE